MKIVRLFVSGPLGTCEYVRYRLPVRIGWQLQDECQLAHLQRSFHLELDWANDRLLLRDLGPCNGVLVRVAGEMREFRGRELTTASREIEFAIAGVWVRASVEERRLHRVAEAAHEAIEEIVAACARTSTRDDESGALRVLAALGRGAITLRGSLQADRELSEAERSGPQDEVAEALMRWTQTSVAVVSFIEEILEGTGKHGA
jgi:hypothetical protein